MSPWKFWASPRDFDFLQRRGGGPVPPIDSDLFRSGDHSRCPFADKETRDTTTEEFPRRPCPGQLLRGDFSRILKRMGRSDPPDSRSWDFSLNGTRGQSLCPRALFLAGFPDSVSLRPRSVASFQRTGNLQDCFLLPSSQWTSAAGEPLREPREGASTGQYDSDHDERASPMK